MRKGRETAEVTGVKREKDGRVDRSEQGERQQVRQI
jgi:hypothetical protein